MHRFRRRSAHYSILFCSLNSIDTTSLPPVGATSSIPSDEVLSYYDSPIYFGILENKKRLEIEVKKQDLQDFYRVMSLLQLILFISLAFLLSDAVLSSVMYY